MDSREGATRAGFRRIAAGAGTGLLMALLAGGCPEARPAPDFPAADYAVADTVPQGSPLVGTNYTHVDFRSCVWDDRGILDRYAEPGVARLVHDQLREMRDSGIASLRLLLWHMRDVPGHAWGVVPSRGGHLPEPFRSNLRAYATEVRRLGFRRLTVSFAPQWANSPLRDLYDPRRFEENWSFIRDVRAVVREHGPADVRFDLLNEGGPSDHVRPFARERVTTYLRDLWTTYHEAFGVGDATVSVIAPDRPGDRGRRLENLLDAIGSSGAPLPSWFEIHVNHHAAGVAWGLRYVDSVLVAEGLDQPLTVGETSYDDESVASSLSDFMERSDRPVDEVVQWFKRAGARCEVSPPYRADAYLRLTRSGDSARAHHRTDSVSRGGAAPTVPKSDAPSGRR